ncbi:MAG: SCO family protein [Planctomycetota bacterium]
MSSRRDNLLKLVMAISAMLVCASASAQILLEEGLPEVQGVGIDAEKMGNALPLDAEFAMPDGRPVKLGDFFDGSTPVLLVPSYFDCPMLCTLVQNRLQQGLNDMSWTAGEEFRIVSFSFDHTDGPEQAETEQFVALAGYAHEIEDPDEAWTFLTTDATTAREVCNALGYTYRYLPENGEFSHVAGIFFCTPDGSVHNFIEGLEYPARNLTLGLSEAADGSVGTVFDRVFLSCFRYDPQTGEYVVHPMNVMRIGAGGAAVVILGTIAALLLRSRIARGTSSPYSAPRLAVGQES